VNAGSTLKFTISGSDADGGTLKYSASGLPFGASFNTSTRTFSWKPGSNQKGTYTVRFQVSDGSLIDYEDITIAVNSLTVNKAPVVNSITSKKVKSGSYVTFTVTGSDPDGDKLTYSASGIPSGAIFSSTSRTFTWTPKSGQIGTYSISFRVSDGKLTSQKNVTIQVIK
jgi:hypothetical protein